jgi:DNA repair protein RadC
MVLLSNSHTKLVDAQDAVKILRDLLKAEDEIDQEKEHVYIIHLNTRSVIKMVELVSLGTLNGTSIHPREVFRRAVSAGSCSIILAHNHPSNEVDPSEEDSKATKLLQESGSILGIEVLDHIVFGFTSFFSFRDNATHDH